MNTKTNTAERITATSKKTEKHPQTFKTYDAGHKHVTTSPAKEYVLLGKGDIVVTVKREEKAKDQKRISPTISSPGQKAERKRSATSNGEILQKWGPIFRESCMKQCSKQTKSKEDSNVKRMQQNGYNKPTGTISKSVPSQEKPKKDSKTYVLVQDRGVQCPEISKNTNRFHVFNPVRTLSFLMKELKDLVIKKDDRICEIFTEMENVLFRIPEKLESEDLEKIDTLEASALQLKEFNKKVKTMYESWASERERYESSIRKKEEQIKEASQKQVEVGLHTEMLTKKLEEITRVIKAKNEAISTLEQQIENDERIISNLKTKLTNQTELNEYLIMDKDKLSKLSSYKDTLIIQYQNTISDLQTQIEKLKLQNVLSEVFVKEGSMSSQASAIQTGLAYSSPTSSFSDHSNKSLHDVSDISTVENASEEDVSLKEDIPVKDSARLEFVSLLDGESSHTIMQDQSQVMNDKGTVMHNKSNIASYRNVNDVFPKKCLHHSSKKGHNKENDVCKIRKFSRVKERQKDNTKNSFCHNTSKIFGSITSTKPMVSDIWKQGCDTHINRIPVNVPSPLRNYPHPDWSESSLPSVSTASDLDMSYDKQSYNTHSSS
ncbi:uncharacterized protein [Anoplolepis gracilipes]|uniref:uncharacterized protein isoform X2 n=1 Tax=Anoplolepis gracilipes TaxID=354296 RepID=UPI003BA1C22A